MCPDKTRTQDTICAFSNCTSKVWQDPDGSFSSYCGITHRDAAIALADPVMMCKVRIFRAHSCFMSLTIAVELQATPCLCGRWKDS
ncbi:hypothetical protein BC629DRAFT_199737 [Irpex lacteus]|nr:hypothetical protein BC629DRAFT_199737 [Irpex lacteus]